MPLRFMSWSSKFVERDCVKNVNLFFLKQNYLRGRTKFTPTDAQTLKEFYAEAIPKAVTHDTCIVCVPIKIIAIDAAARQCKHELTSL